MSEVIYTFNKYPDLIFSISFVFGFIVGFLISSSFYIIDEVISYLKRKRRSYK